MPRRPPAPPRLLLALVSAVITAFALIYGFTTGWFSPYMIYLYIFLICYYAIICNGNRVATAYTVAGSIASSVFLLAIKFLDPVLGTIIGVTATYFVTFMTEIIVKCDWNYFSLEISPFPLERMVQYTYDQHSSAVDAAVESRTADVLRTPEKEESEEQVKLKKKVRSPPSLSRRERKAEARKQGLKGKNPKLQNR